MNKSLDKLMLGGVSLEPANNMAASIGTFQSRIKICSTTIIQENLVFDDIIVLFYSDSLVWSWFRKDLSPKFSLAKKCKWLKMQLANYIFYSHFASVKFEPCLSLYETIPSPKHFEGDSVEICPKRRNGGNQHCSQFSHNDFYLFQEAPLPPFFPQFQPCCDMKYS